LDRVEFDESDTSQSDSPKKSFSKEENNLPMWNTIFFLINELHELDELDEFKVNSGSYPK